MENQKIRILRVEIVVSINEPGGREVERVSTEDPCGFVQTDLSVLVSIISLKRWNDFLLTEEENRE